MISMLKRPAKTVRIGRKVKKRKVVFKFLSEGATAGVQCRVDSKKYSSCRSPRSLFVRPGKHKLRLRALYPSGRPGVEKVVKFKVVRKVRKKSQHR